MTRRRVVAASARRLAADDDELAPSPRDAPDRTSTRADGRGGRRTGLRQSTARMLFGREPGSSGPLRYLRDRRTVPQRAAVLWQVLSPIAGSRTLTREDAGVSGTPVACAVCNKSGRPGTWSPARDIFICTSCQADARQLMEIQDSIWPVAGDTGRSSDETGQPRPAPPPAE